MNSFMAVWLGLYSVGVGVQRPEDRKVVPAVEPAKKAGAEANPLVPLAAPKGKGPAGFPLPFNPGNGGAGLPGIPNGFRPPIGFPGPMLPPIGAQAGGGMPPMPMGGPVGPPQGNPMGVPREKVELPKNLVPTLIEALKDKDQNVRKYVASALARVGREAVEPLIEVLKGKDKAQRANAAYILGQIGAEAREAMPLLVKALKEDDKDLRLRAAFALERLLAAPRNNMMGMGMGGMAMPMAAMMGGQEKKLSVILPADPGPVGPSVEDVKPAKETEIKKPEKEPEKKGDKDKK